jgi:hypothetical protein
MRQPKAWTPLDEQEADAEIESYRKKHKGAAGDLCECVVTIIYARPFEQRDAIGFALGRLLKKLDDETCADVLVLVEAARRRPSHSESEASAFPRNQEAVAPS